MNKGLTILLATLVIGTGMARTAEAHCQIPCGIYDDELRAGLLTEHITTIEKSMKQIVELSAAEKPDYNQLARWVKNKEDHVALFSEIVTYYFMAQRIKPAKAEDKAAHALYVKQVALLHRMLVTAMQAKQSTNLAHIAELRRLLGEFVHVYPGLSHKH